MGNGTAGSGGTGGGSGGAGNTAGNPGMVIPPGPPPSGDPGTKLIHRLNNYEYNNTVQDLLGTTLAPATANWSEGEAGGFDTIAETHRVDEAQYERYFNAAVAVTDDVFANPALVANIVTCPTQDDPACIQAIINGFGSRAFRRPLTAEEVTTYSTVYANARAQAEDHTGSVKQVVRAMLSSSDFLFRIEADPVGDTAPHLLNAYDLASRLSYFLWASMPDAALFAAAADNTLNDPAVLDAQIDRMLGDAKINRFVQSFAGQWLGVRKIAEHAVFPEVFPEWNAELGNSMMTEAYSFFAEFVGTERPWSDFLRADFNYVDFTLASHYGMQAPLAGSFERVEVTTDQRFGFLGLGAFLTLTSYEHRTSPTLRARWILNDLLCTPPPPPPENLMIPELDEPGTEAQAGEDNIRAKLEQHRQDPLCAGCHAVFDPFGIALENFDGIGRYRTEYPNGDPIDPSGVFPDGSTFAGLPGMVEIALARPGFNQCVSEKMFVYSTGRLMRDSTLDPTGAAADQAQISFVRDNWLNAANGIPTVRRLIKGFVMSEPFRYRRATVN
jgi:hypothetical protein